MLFIDPVVPVEIHALVSASQSEKSSTKVHKYMMESVLTFMVSEVNKCLHFQLSDNLLFVFTNINGHCCTLFFICVTYVCC